MLVHASFVTEYENLVDYVVISSEKLAGVSQVGKSLIWRVSSRGRHAYAVKIH